MRRKGVLGAIVLMAASLLWGCGGKKDATGSTKAFRASHRSQLIGGLAALAEVGDFILENDEIRVAILQPGNSVGPGIFGGSLIDADLKRPQAKYQGGHGMDQFSEFFPSLNLLVPNPPPGGVWTGPDWDGPPTDQPTKACPTVWPTDKDGQPLSPHDFSVVCAKGPGDNYLQAMSVLGIIIGKAQFQTDYVLRKGVRYIEVTTVVVAGNGDVSSARPMCPFRRTGDNPDEPEGVLGAIVGDDDYHQGLLGGDFLLFGKRLHLFVPGLGYDERSYVMDKFMHGADTLNHPSGYEFMTGIGDKVSYGLVTDRKPTNDAWGVCGSQDERPGELLVPIETGSFTFTFSGWWRCPVSVHGCQDGGKLYYKRYFIIGSGDPASILDVAYGIWNQPTGTLHGVAYDRLTSKPVTHARVFVLWDPTAPEWAAKYPKADSHACDPLRSNGKVVSYQDLQYCARAASVTADLTTGQFGLANEVLADRGDDPVLDGKFSLKLPPGHYYVVGYKDGRNPSDAQRIEITAEKSVGLGVPMPSEGQVQYDIRDETGHRVAAKITVVGDCKDAQGNDVCNCFPGTDPTCQGDGVPDSGHRYLELGDTRFKGGIVKKINSATGLGSFVLAPGRYRFMVTHGVEYSMDEQVLTVPDDGRAVHIVAHVQHVVDTTGWVSGDFHVHGQNSFDAVVKFADRITSFLVEGLEILSSSDHDWITDYGPIARRMGVQHWLKTQIGLELTTVEIGHFIAFPLKFDENAPENGAVDWRGLVPKQIFTALRNLGKYGPSKTVVLVPHPRDSFFGYFDQFGLDPFDLTLKPGFLQQANTILSNTNNFDPTADAIELINSKRYDMIRTPSNGEVRKFNKCIEFLRGEIAGLPSDMTSDDCHADWTEDQASEYWVRRVLTRSPEESAGFRYEKDATRQCISDPDCAAAGLADHYCDRNTGTCRKAESCSGDPDCSMGTCNTATGLCWLDSVCDPNHADECGAGLVCDPHGLHCVEPCRDNWDCHPDASCCMQADCGCIYGGCDPGTGRQDGAGVCVEAGCEPDADWETAGSGTARPCVAWQGVVEDWFRFLNHGVVFTAMGNSDTHTLTRIEGGMPHNFVRSSTDDPSQIDSLEIAENIKKHHSFLTYGPFIEMWINGEEIGSQLVVPAPDPVSIRIRIQSPDWFDVDRVEVYRNGGLRWVFQGSDSSNGCTGPESGWPCRDVDGRPGLVTKVCDCIPTTDGHNVEVKNMDITFSDAPEHDSWYAAIAMAVGPKARMESPIYTPVYYPEMTFGLIVNAAFANFDIGIDLSEYVKPIPSMPQVSPIVPYAITNPIWVDRDTPAGGRFSFQPPGGPPVWLMNAAATRSEPFPFSDTSAKFRTVSRLSQSHVMSLNMNKVRAFFLRSLQRAQKMKSRRRR
ncbi:MAG: hypothetical protein J7M25_14670 [Deltaproteobacteria bacterium]|nr:hypothetical protein [Deltaproteobacteria bacterium]